ncbi:diguanylate cyclase [Anaerofustis stercorihominis]|uniref:bifunctional diguanylate cyclase/phosphohydrolase n=1 Tax=Anaerofustis stercorihominis TaxID=214853 RepID=UPI003995AD02
MENALSLLPVGVLKVAVIDEHTIKFEEGNDNFYDIVSINKEAISNTEIKNVIFELCGEEIFNKEKDAIFNALKFKEEYSSEFEVRLKGNNEKWVLVRLKLAYEENGPKIIFVLVDINKQKQVVNRLVSKIETSKLIDSISKDVQFEYDCFFDTITIPFDEAQEKDIPAVTSDFIKYNIDRHVHPDYITKFKNIFEGRSKSDKGSFEYRGSRLNNSEFFWLKMSYFYLRDDNKKLNKIIGRFSVIESEKQARIKLEKQLSLDPLTGILNKVASEAIIKELIENSNDKENKHGLLVIDVDDFKNINDSYGHKKGDSVITLIAKILDNTFRSTDTIGRIGGDEFIVFLKNADNDIIIRKGNELKDKLMNDPFPISVSIGISIYPDDGKDYIALFSKADIAMYQAKLNKNEKVICYSGNEPKREENREKIKKEIKKRESILIVDDEELNREILKIALEDEYNILMAADGEEALKVLEENKNKVVLILLDIVMPKMDGVQFLTILRNELNEKDIPVIVISAGVSENMNDMIYQIGVEDIMRKPFDNFEVKNRAKNLIDLFKYRNHLVNLVDEQKKKIDRQMKSLQESQSRILSNLSTLIEFRSLKSGGHVNRIKKYVNILLKALVKINNSKYDISKEEIDVITEAAALHDLGKIAVPDNIIKKGSILNYEENEIMKTHTIQGAKFLSKILETKDEYYIASRDIALYHHERYDGKGYPYGLKGDNIPVSAQVVGLIDVYDALTMGTPNGNPISHSKASEMIINGKCGAFSDDLISAFIAVLDQFEKVDKSKS